MKPYLIVAGNFVETGGMDRPNLALALYLAEMGNEVHLAAFSGCEYLLEHPNVTLHRAAKIGYSNLLSEPLLDFTGQMAALSIKRRGGRVVVNGGNCQFGDVNWVHYVHAAYKPLSSGTIQRRFKTTVGDLFYRWRERIIVPSARLVIVPSKQTKRDLIDKLGVGEDRIQVVPYGIDGARFRPGDSLERAKIRDSLQLPREKLLACFVGGFDGARKGFDVLFAAWQYLCGQGDWDVDLLAIGDGPDRASWIARAREAGLQSTIKFLGFREDVAALYKCCDVYVFPTRYETYSLSTKEALCCGLPAFVSGSTGIAEHYPPELSDLLLPNPNDTMDLVRRLKYWRENVEQFRQRVLPFSHQLAEYTWQTMAREIVQIIEKSEPLPG